MTPIVCLDGRPAQGRPRGMGVYVRRLLPALVERDEPLRWRVALDRRAGEDPWPELTGIERVWGEARHPAYWEQGVLPGLARGAALLHCTANTAPWRAPLPYIVTIHDAIWLRAPWQIWDRFAWRRLPAYAYYRFGVGRGARCARLVLTDSEHSRSQLIERLHLDPGRLRAIPLAEPFPAQPLGEPELEAELAELGVQRPYLLGLGAGDPRKNTANLVRAFARLPRSAIAMLVLAGFEQEQTTSIPGLVRDLGLEPRVRRFGYLPERRLTALLQGAAVFVYPTLAEGFGLPLLLAFGLGVPVVTSRMGAVPEVAGEAARYADPRDPRSIDREIVAVLTDSNEAHRLAYAGYLQAKKFDWNETARRTAVAYHQAIGRTARG